MQKNKSVLVTGAAKRIGKSICEFFASIGWNVAIHCNESIDEANELKEYLNSNFNGEFIIVQHDLFEVESLDIIISKTTEAFGHLDLLINNASLFEYDDSINFTKKSLDKHFNINLYAPIELSKLFLKQLPNNLKGDIVNIVDYSVVTVPDSFFSYSLSKTALYNATKIMAKNFAPRIKVNAIGPGAVIKNYRQSDEHFETSYKNTPLGVQIKPVDIINIIKFFIDSECITGQLISPDSGKNLMYIPYE